MLAALGSPAQGRLIFVRLAEERDDAAGAFSPSCTVPVPLCFRLCEEAAHRGYPVSAEAPGSTPRSWSGSKRSNGRSGRRLRADQLHQSRRRDRPFGRSRLVGGDRSRRQPGPRVFTAIAKSTPSPMRRGADFSREASSAASASRSCRPTAASFSPPSLESCGPDWLQCRSIGNCRP